MHGGPFLDQIWIIGETTGFQVDTALLQQGKTGRDGFDEGSQSRYK
jgi:hypothetical protein